LVETRFPNLRNIMRSPVLFQGFCQLPPLLNHKSEGDEEPRLFLNRGASGFGPHEMKKEIPSAWRTATSSLYIQPIRGS
jgi:hypothetical protein